MEVRRVAGAACAVAGIWLLTGPGWALLAAAVLLTVVPVPQPARAAAARARAATVRTWRALQARLASPERLLAARKTAAVAALPPAVLLAAVGVGIIGGVGFGLLAAGVAMGGVSLLSGWNA